MEYDVIIKNGQIVTNEIRTGTLAIKAGKIAEILYNGELPQAKSVIDAKSRYVFPGAIDTHAHLNEPGYEWREDYAHGTRAAAIGGYTTVIDMPLQNEPAMTTAKLLERKKEIVEKNAYVDFSFWGGLVPDNLDDLKDLWNEGVVAFKSFIGPVSPDYSSLSYGQVYEALKLISDFGGKVGFHCEDFSMIRHLEETILKSGRSDYRAFLDSRPVSAEMVATLAVIEIAKELGAKVHICHVSSPAVAKKIHEAQTDGQDVTAETCAHYLSMTEEDVLKNGALFKCAPPLRSCSEMNELWEYVKNGTFSGIASDHSPCTYEEKFEKLLDTPIKTAFDAWGGISGIQSCFQTAFYEGCVKRGLSPEIFAKAMAENPAKAFGLYGRKGALKKGFDADVVIVDPEAEWEITADSLEYINHVSAYVGRKGKGLPILTMVRGEIAAKNGHVTGEAGYGRFTRRQQS